MSAKLSQLADADLCVALGCDERTLRRWRKQDTAPKDNDKETWLAWVEANGKGRGASQTKTQLQEEKLRRDIRLADLKIAREEGATVLVSDVREFLGQMAARHGQLLRMKYDTELPVKLAGKDIVGIRQVTAATTDEVTETVNRGLLEWNPAS